MILVKNWQSQHKEPVISYFWYLNQVFTDNKNDINKNVGIAK